MPSCEVNVNEVQLCNTEESAGSHSKAEKSILYKGTSFAIFPLVKFCP